MNLVHLQRIWLNQRLVLLPVTIFSYFLEHENAVNPYINIQILYYRETS